MPENEVINYIELFSGIGGFRYGLEACNGEQQENAEIRGRGNSVSGKSNQSIQSQEWRDNVSRNPTDSPNDKSRTSQHQECSFRCVWANDIDKYASAIYRKKFGGKELCEGDIRTINSAEIPDHDLIVGGFPCQSFSIAGKREAFSDIRGTLFFEICRIARDKRTPYLWLENVKGLLSAPYTEDIQEWDEKDFDENGEPTTNALKKHKSISGTKGWVFLTILNTLWELGYDCQWQMLNSKDYGVPQNRERVFIIGHLRGRGRPQVFPIVENTKGIAEGTNETVVVGALSAGAHSGGMHSGMTLVRTRSTQDYKERDISPPVRQSDKGEVRVYNIPQAQRIRETNGIASTLQGNAGGQGGAETPKIMIDIPNIAQSLQTDGQLRNGSSWSTNNPQSSRNIRRLTPIECERLQGFPDNWTKYGIDINEKQIEISDTQRYKCCGNAVTTNVITVIGDKLINVGK